MTAPSAAIRIGVLAQPGRFPTVVHDPGGWWGQLTQRGHRLQRIDLNAPWWRLVCSGDAPVLSPEGAGVATTRWPSRHRAETALGDLKRPATYTSVRRYLAVLDGLRSYLEEIRPLIGPMDITLAGGPAIRNLDYASSAALIDYAEHDSPLMRSIVLLAQGLPRVDVLFCRVTSPEDLLTAAIAVVVLKRRNPGMHACLADHGYENFSLRRHLDNLRAAQTLDRVFDSIVEERDDRDALAVEVADGVASGEPPRGFLRRPPGEVAAGAGRPMPPMPTEVFAPEPILSTRLSERRCYWSRCTFCVHNEKYVALASPSLADVPAAVERLAAHTAAGYRTVIYSDEALSPSLIERFTDLVSERGLADGPRGVRWSCRCKPERSFSRSLFERMAGAGCFEVLFGIESVSARTLGLMDKRVDGLGRLELATMVADAGAAGLGVHLNFIAGFPGESLEELRASIDFAGDVLAGVNHGTFFVNRFVLFSASPVARDPDRFGVRIGEVQGDMPAILSYTVAPAMAAESDAVDAALPRLRRDLAERLGWGEFVETLAGRTAMEMYFGSGHGAIFKADRLPMAAPAVEIVA